ncbi:FUSC family protein [Agrococcus sp. SGAir0287]|uniref:FUSC family protein n=1 Tax=Agrococcus sp. SGAir0287 TaxID=2070347 RepID=UPI0010F5FE32|nr:FUSC family protein [Agrococcus sp. SGAir0287]
MARGPLHHARGVLGESVRVAPAPGAHRVAIRGATVLAVALGVLLALDRLDLGIAAAFGAFASIYGGRRPTPTRWRMQAWMGALLTTTAALGALVGQMPWRTWLAIALVGVVAGLATWASDAQGWRPPGPFFLVFAAGACSAVPFALADVPLVPVVAASTAALAVALGALEQVVLPTRAPAPPAPPRDPMLRWQVARAVVAVVVAGLLATLAVGRLPGADHPYWAMLAASVAFAVPHAHGQLARGIQRVVGTALGLGVAWLLLSASLSPVATIAVVVVLQLVIELVIGWNYAVGLVAITPLALLLVHLAAPVPIDGLLLSRLVETVLGVAVAAVAIVTIRPWRRPS